MFERYTEAARRALFFARYEASEAGSISIEPEPRDSDESRDLVTQIHARLDALLRDSGLR